MQKNKITAFINNIDIVFFVLFLAIFLSLTIYNYLLFHTLAEIFSIVIGFAIFIIAWNSRQFIDNNYLIFIGVGYLFIAFLDLMHTLSYKGMNIIVYGANVSTQLWISARFLEAITLLVAPLFIRRKLKYHFELLFYLISTLIILLSIFYWNIFPVCYTGTELTMFKIISEYIIIALLISSIFLLFRFKAEFSKRVITLLISSIIITAIGEIFFTLYRDVYSLFNLLGHLFKIISFFLVYKALIETGLKKPYDLLFRRLKRSRDLLEDKSHKLELINKDLKSFAYTLSHDLKGPLRRIDGYSYSLQDEYSQNLDSEGNKFLKNIRDSVKKMSQIINDILKISQISTIKINYNKFNVSKMAKEIFEELKEQYKDKKVEFLAYPGMIMKADKSLIYILLTNLLENSLKFTNDNADSKIEFKNKYQGDKIIYYIKDNGIGMDMQFANKVFKPFEKAHEDKKIKGSGIGLATAKKVVNIHKGKIWIESERNKGTTIYFTLGV